MNKEELLALLRSLQDQPNGNRDVERCHLEADRALLEYIADRDVTEAFRAIRKWYA